MTLQALAALHFVEQTCPTYVPGAGPFILFFFAASDGAAEIAIATTATAPTSRTFAKDFMTTPSVNNTCKITMGAIPSQYRSGGCPP